MSLILCVCVSVKTVISDIKPSVIVFYFLNNPSVLSPIKLLHCFYLIHAYRNAVISLFIQYYFFIDQSLIYNQ